MRKKLSILGSTGSIGVNALLIAEQYADEFEVIGLAAGGNLSLLAKQIARFRPRIVSVADEEKAEELTRILPEKRDVEIVYGVEGGVAVAEREEIDCVVSAIVGAAGMLPTYAALIKGKQVALANKESLVAAGPIMKQALAEHGGELLPVDSEHCAIFQALAGNEPRFIRKVLLTASGGPFLHTPKEDFANLTPKEALKHPRWNMGAKISIDSATMINKGLEIIEACYLFDLSADQIQVQVHPESIVHSMVEYVDGSVIAQLGVTDMRGPLAYALAYPRRLEDPVPALNLSEIGKLTFLDPDQEKFPALRLAYEAAEKQGSLPAVLNAANEICVHAFLENQIRFDQIPTLIAQTMQDHEWYPLKNMDSVLEADAWAREHTRKNMERS